ncbi:flagellar assembly protein FliW [Sporosarcina highlanderae]|uniref:Flagellar assembly factor FliW n=1 Tax=Sporosarcina highlanderae TaxID=3035916 RepID=A0ABT8JPQ3_9BACL|nr:flagellar assembly protein FliW [Sporosarcina highlanderae]MDN4606793.1 flagellar assembly protein FliW [Sporosarcina highlanderae]
MQIQTKFNGEISIQPDQIWTFPKGIPGFESEKQFALLPIEGNSNFQVLQSATTAAVAFIVSNPYTLIKDYSFDIDEPTIELLNIEKPEDVFVLAILTLKQPFETSTINLQAPLIFQLNNKTAKQMIINDNRFKTRHVIGQVKEEV